MYRLNYLTVFLFAVIVTYGFTGNKDKKPDNVMTNGYYNYISINSIKMYISNNGDGSHDPSTDANGLYWPGGENATQGAVFEDGLVWAGIMNGDTAAGGSTYRHGLQAGKILEDGTADDPNLFKYRVYKVLDGWENLPPSPERDLYERDYNEWPAEDGAPFNDINNDGIFTPGIDNPYIGQETMWCVSNDLDSGKTDSLYGSPPMGVEVQTLVYAFNPYNQYALQNTVFKKYKIINKGQNTINNMYFSYWSDDDLGDANDDFIGCDTGLNMGYTYNSDDEDYVYGTPPPAVGHMFVQGPIVPGTPTDTAYFDNEWRDGFRNLAMTAFGPNFKNTWITQDPPLGTHEGSIQTFNVIRGLDNWGDSLVNPHTNETTVFALSGSPVSGTGWYEGSGWPGGPNPGDRRLYITAGPFTMAPGDTQEVAIAILLAEGTDNIQSVAALKERALEIQNYYGAYTITGVKDKPVNTVEGFRLFQNYPNPFNPITSIQYAVGSRQFVTLKIYDVLGNEIATLVNEEKSAGHYTVEFDGSKLSSGIYFYQMKAGSFTATKKLILLK
jgi:hypothetical protein